MSLPLLGCHHLWPAFPGRSDGSSASHAAVLNPMQAWFGLLRFRSPLLAEWMLSVFSSGY